MFLKSTNKDFLILFIFIFIILIIQLYEIKYLKFVSIDLIKLIQNDQYIIVTMKYVSILGSEQFRLFSIAFIIVIGTKFQLFLLIFLYSFCCLFVNFLKINIRDNRPYWNNNDIKGYDCAFNYGFPTDHLIISIPFYFLVWEVMFDRLEFKSLVNAKYFKLIGKFICIFICLSIGFSRLVLGLNYLDQFLQGFLIGLLIWFVFQSFIDFSEFKLFLEMKIIFNKKIKFSFILIYNLLYFVFLLNFLYVLKNKNVETESYTLLKNYENCGKRIFPLDAMFASLLESTKYYCFFTMIILQILHYDERKINKIKAAFHIDENNKDLFYELCLKYYINIKDKIEKTKFLNSEKSLLSCMKKNIQNNNPEENLSKSEFLIAKYLLIFIIYLAFAFIQQCLYLFNSFIFSGKIITMYYLFELPNSVIIGYLALKINSNIYKYFK